MAISTGRSRRIVRGPTGTVPRGMRRLVVGGSVWHWRYGDPVTVRSPDGTGTRIPLSALKGMCDASVERAVEKGNMSVRPSDVAAWIARKMLGYTDRGGYPKGIDAGHLPPPQPGVRSVLGPRGRWRWHAGPWNTTIVSPEGVGVEVRTYELLGMTMEQWTDRKCEIIRTLREPVRGMLRQTDTLRLLDCDVPGMPMPDDAAVTKWVSAFAGTQHESLGVLDPFLL